MKYYTPVAVAVGAVVALVFSSSALAETASVKAVSAAQGQGDHTSSAGRVQMSTAVSDSHGQNQATARGFQTTEFNTSGHGLSRGVAAGKVKSKADAGPNGAKAASAQKGKAVGFSFFGPSQSSSQGTTQVSAATPNAGGVSDSQSDAFSYGFGPERAKQANLSAVKAQ